MFNIIYINCFFMICLFIDNVNNVDDVLGLIVCMREEIVWD